MSKVNAVSLPAGWFIRAVLVAATLLGALPGVSRAESAGAVADVHTLATPPLREGEIELLTVSTFPDTVTAGDVLVRVRGVQPDDDVEIRANGRPVPVPAVTPRTGDRFDVLVDGLADGRNTISAIVTGPLGRRSARLEVQNHPITGPVTSGPHQEPFRCRTVDLGLGQPLDEDCSAPTTYQWFYVSTDDRRWHPLTDPTAPYPDDLATTELKSEDPERDGRAVPFVARVETAVINRGVARIAVLDDPRSRPAGQSFSPNWNGRVYHSFGQACGVGYDQGRNSVRDVLGEPTDPSKLDTDNVLGLTTRVSQGDVVVHSTLTSFGNHCNPFVSMETAMLLKEHVTERYPQRDGLHPIRTYIGTGNSGGALQQYNAVNNAPGLLDAALPATSFADIATTAMTWSDCQLLVAYFAETDLEWSEVQQAVVTGHNAQTGTSPNSICASWADSTATRLDPTTGCSVADGVRYHPQTNPTGARCTIQDANVNWLGRDPATGFARRPLDNVGVQYGLRAFDAGLITFEQFADLNRRVGGIDVDGRRQPARHAMDEEVASIVYRVGQVIGRGALAETPVIDLAPYLDLVPGLNIHESSRPFIVRQRVRQAGGSASTMGLWRGVVFQADAFEEIDAWVAALNARPSSGDRIRDVGAAKPLTSMDQCALGTVGGGAVAPGMARTPLGVPVPLAPGAPGPSVGVPRRAFVPEDHESGVGPCSAALPPVTTTRIAAGGPTSDDVIKCQRMPVTAAGYRQVLSPAQVTELRSIFPDGVCDWSKPSIGDVTESIRWPSLGGDRPHLDADGNVAPVSLVWRTARSG